VPTPVGVPRHPERAISWRAAGALSLTLFAGCGFGLTPDAIHCGKHWTGADIWVDGTDIWQGPLVDGGFFPDPYVLPDGGPWRQPDGGLTYPDSDGGFPDWTPVPIPPGAMHPHMTCDQAMVEMDQATQFGLDHHFWIEAPGQDIRGVMENIRIEFINQMTDAVIGSSDTAGLTEDYLGVHEMAVTTGNDLSGNNGTSATFDPAVVRNYPAVSYQPSVGILVHEMTHAWQFGLSGLWGVDNNSHNHCNWTTIYAPSYTDLEWVENTSGGPYTNGPGTYSLFTDDCTHMTCQGSVCNCAKGFSYNSNGTCTPN
jgi:hypothetical protein